MTARLSLQDRTESRRSQNRHAQQRWRAKQRDMRLAARALEKGDEPALFANQARDPFSLRETTASPEVDRGHITTTLHGVQPCSSASVHWQGEEIGGGIPQAEAELVDAADIIEALALPATSEGADEKQEDFPNAHIGAVKEGRRHFTVRNMTMSQLLSLAYCAASALPVIEPIRCMHFAQAMYENARRLRLNTQFLSQHRSVSYIAQDWQRYQESMSSSPEELPIAHLTRSDALDTTSPAFSSSRLKATTRGTNATGHSCSSAESLSTQTEMQPASHERLPLRWDAVPKNMYPTREQLTIPHHPYIDVAFPWPSMRTKILTLLNTVIDPNDICDAVFKAGLPGAEQSEPSFFIWGDDAMDPGSWEVGETFARRWWFLLEDDILMRTNWWRRRRGLSQLTSSGATSLVPRQED